MTERLEDQIRRQTEAFYEQAPPVGSLIPEEMAEQLGLSETETDRETVLLQPQPVQRRLSGRVVFAGAAVLVLLVFTPILIWLNNTSQDAAGPDQVIISGEGTMGPITSGETVRFTLSARSSDTATSNIYPATGQIEITTIDSGQNDPWSIQGSVVCMTVLENHGIDAEGGLHDVWQFRYQITQSTFPADETARPPGYANFYVKDTESGDWAGELTGTVDFTEPQCGPRGADIPLFPLNSGEINVQTPRT